MLKNIVEREARYYLINKRGIKETELIRHYPDFYDAENKQFYEIKRLKHKGSGRLIAQFEVMQCYAFDKLNPIILFLRPNDKEPIYEYTYHNMIEKHLDHTLPFRVLFKKDNHSWVMK
jgi:hypothetical protein